MAEKEKLEKDVNTLKSNVEKLTTEINHKLFLGFEIMCDVIKEIKPDSDFKKLDEIVAMEATRHVHVTTPKEGEEGLKDLVVPAALSNILVAVKQNVQVVECGSQGVLIALQFAGIKTILPEEHTKAKAGSDDGSKGAQTRL